MVIDKQNKSYIIDNGNGIDDEKKILPSTMVTKQFKSFTVVISNQNQLN